MNKETDPIDTDESPNCPQCGYIVFVANEGDDGDYYCMDCGKAWDADDVDGGR